MKREIQFAVFLSIVLFFVFLIGNVVRWEVVSSGGGRYVTKHECKDYVNEAHVRVSSSARAEGHGWYIWRQYEIIYTTSDAIWPFVDSEETMLRDELWFIKK